MSQENRSQGADTPEEMTDQQRHEQYQVRLE